MDHSFFTWRTRNWGAAMEKENKLAHSKTAIIRDLNDRLRQGDKSVSGQIVLTNGVVSLFGDPVMEQIELFEAVKSFDAFNEDNDPHNEHDFGAFDFKGEKLFWKIDYYAPDMMHGSEDPNDCSITVRLLTILLAREY
ncbi:MAG: DUF3768 domain-containing protein [Cyanobacteria bacterium J06555_13]